MNEVNGELIEDRHGIWTWKTIDGRLIPVSLMTDSHLRNAALFLMGMGYTKCIAANKTRILWLTVLRREWERRMLAKDNQLVKRWTV